MSTSNQTMQSEGPLLEAYLADIRSFNLLTRDEELELANRSVKGDEAAIQALISANLRLVVHIATSYYVRNTASAISLLDLISDGNIGLCTAVRRYDPSRGAKLSTYAAWWIKQAVSRGIHGMSTTIRIPIHRRQLSAKLARDIGDFNTANGREPTDQELAQISGIKSELIADLAGTRISMVYLDQEVDENAGTITHHEKIIDQNLIAPDTEVDSSDLHSKLSKFVLQLAPRERDIIERRLGLNGREVHTLEEVGEIYAVTRERCRQLQNSALLKLKRRAISLLQPGDHIRVRLEAELATAHKKSKKVKLYAAGVRNGTIISKKRSKNPPRD